MSVSAFASVTKANTDENLKLSEMYRSDHNLRKLCLFSNIPHDEYNRIYIFPAIERCMKIAIEYNTYRISVDSGGIEEYCQLACAFVLGNNSNAIIQNRCFGVQTISSTGALRLGAQFLREKLAYTTFCTIHPDCRGIYNSVFIAAGFEQGFTLRVPEIENTTFKYFLLDLERVPERSVLVIGICGITSTGLEPTMFEWNKIAYIVARKNLFVFFDATFQGLISGDPDTDAYHVRYFEQKGFEFFIAQDFSFNMGLVSERPGNLCVVQKSASTCRNTKAILSEYMRVSCFTPPVLGAHIVSKILSDIYLREEYQENLKAIVLKYEILRNSFICNLKRFCKKYDCEKYENQKGLYVNIDLTLPQIELLQNEHIYVPNGGWFCIAGLNNVNMDFFCKKIIETVSCANTENSSSAIPINKERIDAANSRSKKTSKAKKVNVNKRIMLSEK
ncbi:GOT1 family protein [Megaselia abdita]